MIAQSEPINISREQKIEVVSTLIAYPLLLNELNITNELLESQRELIMLLNKQLQNKDDQILLLKQTNEISTDQIELLNGQLKNAKKSSWIVPTLIGLSSGLILGIVL